MGSRQPGGSEQGPPDRARAARAGLEAIQLPAAIFDAIHAPVAYLDAHCNFIRVNRAYAEAEGRTPSDLAGTPYFDLYPDDAAAEIFRQVVRTGEPHTAHARPFRHPHHPEQGLSYRDWSLVPVKDPAGTVTGLVLTLTEASERVLALESLRQSEEQFRLLAENLPGVIYLFQNDTEYTPVYLNHAVERLTGYPRSDFLEAGLTFVQLTHPEDMTWIPATVAEALAKREPFHFVFRLRHRSGEWRWIEKLGVGVFQGDGAAFLEGYLFDITERKRAEEALAASEERLRRMIESSPIGIRIDQDARYVYVNPSCVARCGYERAEEILGLPVEALYLPEDHERIRQSRAQLLAGAPAPVSYHARGLRKGGEPFDTITWITPFDHQGRPAVLSFVIDTSVETSLRAQLLHAQKLEAIGTLAGGIAHDFNNLLQAVQGYAQLLLMGKGPEHPEHRSLEEIFSAARKGAELTRQLLTFSRKGRSQKQVLDPNRVVEEACALLRRTIPRMIEIECVLAPALERVRADPLQLQQVLMNLGVNAKDAMPDGGRITVRTETVHLDARFCRTRPGLAPGRHLLLSFSDTGAGIPPETLEHIFEPFYTTKGPGRGTGLGLAIVYGIVKDHGGFIECLSQREAGTCFRVYLPAIEAEPLPAPAGHVLELPRGRETVLVVDDEPAVRDMGQQMLSRYGYTVLTAPDGERALEIYRQDPTRIHLVVLDLVMPGMGGRRCLEALLRVNPKVKVLLASGYSPDAPTDVALGSGARGFIQKPYALAEILGTVRAALDEP